MLRTFAPIGFAAALIASPVAASAQTGTSSSYGAYGNGERIPTQALSPFDRHWNHDNESKRRARESAAWMRRHGKGFPNPF
jgi:hypothetical protein